MSDPDRERMLYSKYHAVMQPPAFNEAHARDSTLRWYILRIEEEEGHDIAIGSLGDPPFTPVDLGYFRTCRARVIDG